MATTSEIHERQWFGDDVIWCGDDEAGSVSPHRILSFATPRGSLSGPATGKRGVVRAVAVAYRRETHVWDE